MLKLKPPFDPGFVVPKVIVASFCGLALGLAGHICPVKAETLARALASAYTNNPSIRAERARQRATDEQVPQALSGWRPTVIAFGYAGVRHERSKPAGGASSTHNDRSPAGIAIELNQPIFRGFRTINETKRAESNVEAGRRNLLAVEQQVLFEAASAFMNVIRDSEIVRLRRKSVSFLTKELDASRTRFEVEQITRTDVSQAEARLSLSRSNLALALSNLQASRANYVRLIGHSPGRLKGAKILARLPKSLKQAISTADRVNPTILAAISLEEASRHNIEVAKGNLLPIVSLRLRYELQHDPSATTRRAEEALLLGELEVPLYQAGRVYSEVREAKQFASERRLLVLDARRIVRENVVTAWHALIAARQTIRSFSDEARANRLALAGVREEALVGSRTTLDILDAQQELVLSQVSLANARRDRFVAAYRLLASIGRMTARDLRLPVSIYQPSKHFDDTRDRLFGTATETLDQGTE